MEIMVNYEPSLVMLGEWLKQLFDESGGQGPQGSVRHTSEFLHRPAFHRSVHSGRLAHHVRDRAVGQGPRSEITIEHTEEDIDGLNYLAGQDRAARQPEGVRGHADRPLWTAARRISSLEIDRTDAWHFGYLVYFFEKACGISGYLLGVNPFNQPGVEDYKKNMFALLGRSGFEERRKYLEAQCQAED